MRNWSNVGNIVQYWSKVGVVEGLLCCTMSLVARTWIILSLSFYFLSSLSRWLSESRTCPTCRKKTSAPIVLFLDTPASHQDSRADACTTETLQVKPSSVLFLLSFVKGVYRKNTCPFQEFWRILLLYLMYYFVGGIQAIVVRNVWYCRIIYFHGIMSCVYTPYQWFTSCKMSKQEINIYFHGK